MFELSEDVEEISLVWKQAVLDKHHGSCLQG